MAEHDVPVAIAGGGLVGLSAAMFLAQHGVASLAIEPLRGGSPVPRAAHFHLRTLELFRLAGVEDEVKEQSEREFLPEGGIIAMDSLAGRKLADIIGSLNSGVEALSPCRRLFITQAGLEPILRRRAHQAGAQVLEGQEVVALDQDADGVSLTCRDVDTGQQQTIRASYFIGADGAHSKVRELLGIPMDGRGNIELGYLYGSEQVHDDPHQSRARVGSRAPHVWLERDGQRISTLDLFGTAFVLLAGPDGAGWCSALARPWLGCYRVGADLIDRDAGFLTTYGLSASGAVLVRPDGFVCWRAEGLVDDPRGLLVGALRSTLGR